MVKTIKKNHKLASSMSVMLLIINVLCLVLIRNRHKINLWVFSSTYATKAYYCINQLIRINLSQIFFK